MEGEEGWSRDEGKLDEWEGKRYVGTVDVREVERGECSNSMYIVRGVLKVTVQRFGLIARDVIISRSAKSLRECSRKLTHSKNTFSLAI